MQTSSVHHQPAHSSRGFTLVELLFAVTIIAIGLLSYIGGNILIGKSSTAAYERSVAIQDANQVIEQIRNTAQTGTFPGNVTAAYPNNGFVAGYNNLTSEQVRVSYASAAADPLDTTVTVTWMSNGTRASTKSLRTLITKRG